MTTKKTTINDYINAIERVIDSRTSRGATDTQLIVYCQDLKKTWNNNKVLIRAIDGFIDAIKQTPLYEGNQLK